MLLVKDKAGDYVSDVLPFRQRNHAGSAVAPDDKNPVIFGACQHCASLHGGANELLLNVESDLHVCLGYLLHVHRFERLYRRPSRMLFSIP